MLPKTLALIDDEEESTEFLAAHLRAQGVQVRVYRDSNDLLADSEPHRFDFYVVDLVLPGVDGLQLIKILRKRTQAGVLVVSGRLAPDVFKTVVDAGADMYLAKPAHFEQVEVAIRAVHRRIVGTTRDDAPWRLDRFARALVAPDGARVDLSEGDVALLECFVDARGEVVTRETLRQRLGRNSEDDEGDGVNAAVYRLRRRIERATPMLVPLQSKSRVGYVFKGHLLMN